MKEMEYLERMTKAEVLDNNTYNGYEYVILSLGTHPCGYVVLEDNDKLYGLHYDDVYDKGYDIDCHGGLTYSEDYLSFLEFSEKYTSLVKTSIKDRWVLGWDYAHHGDYCGWDKDDIMGGKKWTTSEIVDECKDVINQLNQINKGVD